MALDGGAYRIDSCTAGCAQGEEQPGSRTLRRVRLFGGTLFLLLAACLLIASLTLVPVRKAKLRACLRDGLNSGAISAEYLDSSQGESMYSSYYRQIGWGEDLGVPGDPYMAMCRNKYDLDNYGAPLWAATATVLAVFFAVVFSTHTRKWYLIAALIAVFVDAVAWAAAYAIMPMSRNKFHDCLRRLRASGAAIDEDQYSQYWEYGADPWSELGASQDAGVERCNAKYTPSLGTVVALFGFAGIYGCILFIYLVVVIIIIAVRRFCRGCHRKPVPSGPLRSDAGLSHGKGAAEETLPSKEASANVTKAALEGALPISVALSSDVSVPMPPAKV